MVWLCNINKQAQVNVDVGQLPGCIRINQVLSATARRANAEPNSSDICLGRFPTVENKKLLMK